MATRLGGKVLERVFYLQAQCLQRREFTHRTGGPVISVNLKGLSRTALPNDIRRWCGKCKAENVSVGEGFFSLQSSFLCVEALSL